MRVSESAKEVARHVQSNRHSCYTCGEPIEGNNSLCESCKEGWS